MPLITIPRSYADGQVLFKAQLDNAFDAVEAALNDTGLDDSNIVAGGIGPVSLATSSVTTTKLAALSVTLAKLAAEVSERLNPAGTVMAYLGDTAPSGYLLCDGSQVSRSVYASLFGVIGIKHGNGDGTSTFHLPDYRGRFLRGWDHGAGRDVDAASRTAMNSGGATGDNIGSIQDQGVQQLALARNTTVIAASDGNKFFGDPTADSFANSSLGGQYLSNGLGTSHPSTNLVKTRAGSDTETRPINASVNYIIKT